MELEINKLIESEIDEINKIGWLLYDKGINDGLDKEATEQIIELLANITDERDYTDSDFEKAYQEGYDEGYDAAKDTYECDCCC